MLILGVGSASQSSLRIVCNLGFSDIGMMVRVFAWGPGDLGSISGRVIPKTQKMVLDSSLLNTQYYKVGIKDKGVQSRKRSGSLPYILM